MSTPTATAGPGRAPGGADPRRWVALAVVLIAGFMQLVDISIVNVAIPSIQRDLDATYSQIQWVLAGYQLAFAVMLITGGRLGDIYGRKRLFMIGMAGFTVASALCGLAQTPEMLIGSRVLQGLMGAIMFPQILSVIQVTFPPQERATAFGMFGATIGLATITGPLVGGLLIEADLFGLEWRPIFLVNLPIGIAALAVAARFLVESKAPRALRLDPVGVALVTAGLLLLVYPLVQGRDLGWPLWTFLSMAAAVPVLVGFGAYERRKKALDGSPLVDLDLFRQRSFVPGLLVAGIFFMGIPAFFLIFSLWLQIGLGFSALHAGLTGAPFAVGSALASAASVRLAPDPGPADPQRGLAAAGRRHARAHLDGRPLRRRRRLLAAAPGPAALRPRARQRGRPAGQRGPGRHQGAGRRRRLRRAHHRPAGRRGRRGGGDRGGLLRPAGQPGRRRGRRPRPRPAGRPPGRRAPGGGHRAGRGRLPDLLRGPGQRQGPLGRPAQLRPGPGPGPRARRRSAGSWPPPPTPPAARASPRRSSAPWCSRSLVFLAVFLLVFLLPDARGDAAAQHPGAPAA